MTTAQHAAAILAAIAEGRYRFSPAVDPVHGAEWPPGWKPVPWTPAYRMSAAQLEKMAEGRRVANENQKKAGPLSRRKAFTDY